MDSKITVVIPTRNELAENLIKATYSQHPRIQYYLHFDETDEEYKRKADWVKARLAHRSNIHIAVERCGLIEAQNKGVEFAGDGYFMYQHGHDFIGAGIFSLATFLDSDNAAYAYGTLQYTGLLQQKTYPTQYDGEELYKWDFPRNAVLYRASIVRNVGGYRRIHNNWAISTNEEHVLNLDLHEAGYKGRAVSTESPALYFEVHRGGLTETMANNVDFLNVKFREAFPKYTGTLINPSIFD